VPPRLPLRGLSRGKEDVSAACIRLPPGSPRTGPSPPHRGVFGGIPVGPSEMPGVVDAIFSAADASVAVRIAIRNLYRNLFRAGRKDSVESLIA